MHFLTKAFVVLASILAVAVAALTTAYAMNADRIRDDNVSKSAQLAIATNQLAVQQSTHDQQAERLRAQLDEALNGASGLRTRIAQLEGEVNRLTVEKASAEQTVASYEGQFGEANEAIQFQARVIEQMQGEVSTLREQEVEFRDQRLEMRDRISDLEAQVLVLEQARRALEEQLTEARGARGSATSGVSTSFSGPAVQAPVRVTGAVQAVRLEQGTNKELVQFNLGTRDRIAPNVEMYIVRGGRFIAAVKVISADLNNAVGEVLYYNQVDGRSSIQQGDTIRTHKEG